jgi:hypothetical protein
MAKSRRLLARLPAGAARQRAPTQLLGRSRRAPCTTTCHATKPARTPSPSTAAPARPSHWTSRPGHAETTQAAPMASQASDSQCRISDRLAVGLPAPGGSPLVSGACSEETEFDCMNVMITSVMAIGNRVLDRTVRHPRRPGVHPGPGRPFASGAGRRSPVDREPSLQGRTLRSWPRRSPVAWEHPEPGARQRSVPPTRS